MLRPRRRPRYGAQVCAIIAALLLLLSVSILHSRLKFNPQSHPQFNPNNIIEFTQDSTDDLDALVANPLIEDVVDQLTTTNSNLVGNDDRIDELDVVEDDQSRVLDEEEILRGLEDDDEESDKLGFSSRNRRSGFYWDHVLGGLRRSFDKQLSNLGFGEGGEGGELGFGDEDLSRVAFDSDDQPVSEEVRVKLDGIRGIEDVLLLKNGKRNSALREGWADWFEKKGDFLRRDKMFRSGVELLNPLNNPLLQDPDGSGVTYLSRSDKIMQKALWNELMKLPALGKKGEDRDGSNADVRRKIEVKGMERRTLDDNGSRIVDAKSVLNASTSVELTKTDNGSRIVDAKSVLNSSSSIELTKTVDVDSGSSHVDVVKEESTLLDKRSSEKAFDEVNNVPDKVGDTSEVKVDQRIDTKKTDQQIDTEKSDKKAHVNELSDYKYADGKRWGYFPGLYAHLSFSDFIEEFFKQGKCSMRVFMVWNSAPWQYTVRHQRGLESLLYHHRDACVVVFSETIELDFLKNFVNDGFKVAVAMPNLDELLKDTPTEIFASVWFEWRKTKFYPVHYSELVRLAALYKYGGIYLDSDVIVLKPLSSLDNSVGLEDEPAKKFLNGAVMAFNKHSPFILECLKEFYSTYDDSLLRWNGAELLTRAIKRFPTQENNSELNIQLSPIFFPISQQDITRYFSAPADETERSNQHILLLRILDQSYAFHFWNGLTSSIIPEPDSLVAKLLNHHCIHCTDVL
ncbi:lactosylceramide 4-alpha-galactosyltransferase [Ranunculus cassubicifolius]